MDKLTALPQAMVPLLLDWFPAHARALPWRQDREPYHIWLSEIMLQQTRVEAVRDYYTRFLARCPTIAALAEAPEEALEKLWEGLGYYSRLRNLHKAAITVMQDYGGVFPRAHSAVLSLPGVGPYTAGAICSIAYDDPTPAVDGNVLRVVTRLLASDAPIDKDATKQAVALALAAIYPPQAGMFTQSLMELGATVCLPNGTPRCDDCPLNALCSCGRTGTWERYPVRQPKKSRRVEARTVLVLRCDGREAICRRPKHGLLAGLWEYPNVAGTLDAAQALALAERWGCQPSALGQQLERVHIFTHVQWQLRCYYITCREAPPPFTWATRQALHEELALPTAFRMFLEE